VGVASLSGNKSHVRREVLGKRLALSSGDFFRRSLSVQKRFLHLDEFKRSQKVALYKSFRHEVCTDHILATSLRQGKELYFPKVGEGEAGLDFIKLEEGHLFSPGAYSIDEPEGGEFLESLVLLDLVVVPGVAFDGDGRRLGYGKGYYDMTLKRAECAIVALAFNFQVVDCIDSEPHDVGVHKIVTEEGVIDLTL